MENNTERLPRRCNDRRHDIWFIGDCQISLFVIGSSTVKSEAEYCLISSFQFGVLGEQASLFYLFFPL